MTWYSRAHSNDMPIPGFSLHLFTTDSKLSEQGWNSIRVCWINFRVRGRRSACLRNEYIQVILHCCVSQIQCSESGLLLWDNSMSDDSRYREWAYICFYHFSAHLHAKIEQILSRIFTKLSILHFLNSSQRICLKSEFHSLWSHFTMHRWVSTVLTYKAFSLQCNIRILFKDDIFYLWILFRGKKMDF